MSEEYFRGATPRWLVGFAFVVMVGFVLAPAFNHRLLPEPPPSPILRTHPVPLLVPTMSAVAETEGNYRPFTRLPTIHVLNLNNHDQADVRLYNYRGGLIPTSLAVLDRILGDFTKPDEPRYREIDPRVIQVLFRAAYHFRAREIVVISGYREKTTRRESLHTEGRAIDFFLTGVKPLHVAWYLQRHPRLGVGVYTHPRLQYVHVDTRENSYHWADSSGPGESGEGWSVGGLERLARQDAAYKPNVDWPEDTLGPVGGRQ